MPDAPDPLRLDEYAIDTAVALTDGERWPLAAPDDLARLDAVRAHPLAPVWTHRTGDRLTAERARRATTPLPLDSWLDEHLATARRLPAYRRFADRLERLEDFPLVSRDDLVDDVSAFVPLDADFDAMIHGSSSGTTGRALLIPDHIEEVARTFHLIVDLVRSQGVHWQPDLDRLAIAQVICQRQAFTYASLLTTFGFAAMARLNLDLSHWRDADHRAGFLREQRPQVVSGHPTSLAELLDPLIADHLEPLALVSGAMHLSLGLRAALTTAFGCPVIDIYGLHETRPIAVSTDGGPHIILDRRIVVEIVSPAGDVLPHGEFGEIVVTAGENPLLPLVRYRTSDYGRLVEVDGRPAIADLEGREATTFLTGDGAVVPSVDLTQQLQTAGAVGWSVTQDATGAVVARVVGGQQTAVRAALSALLARDVSVEPVARLTDLGPGKPRRYRRTR